ncbi:Fe(3+)-hydroxamate ABC transporter permease FhuB [Burkholderia cenocepacia]|uniref:Fe(3+)-hydroxamate ABC transporter permease FhuB n=1 Tax=Burkholderia cenocepacia TaxID=95486 RepID=UPI000F59264C|nr:Fe(3+)-hydroxamate ABC transporter permease FhuB [Burkholderia cenocepacia]MDR8026808.1 Fe(3+)-hydroxamate ABC transporter permease FhuB [Burkholderia cenocepacia]MDR8044060.1 Fe(3+)-hydroxamate ABC transporter permease FhuB [Burkholderia cenocepacia]QND94860.1 iron(3+)-hydroxamate import system permease protein FhuB [Burkholderia cenocepacia]RQU76946.1 Fe(3+)-hydroxamate ABC transporter permease FhuB [Burkholderia cenocepacia]
MTTFAMRKRLAATGRGATRGRAGAIAFGLVALIALLAALRIAPDLRVWWDAAPGSDAASLAHVFLFDLNLPRVAAALVAGGCLGIAGALFQSLTRNPLASPDLLGVTGGAQLGLLAAMLVPALAGVATVPLLFVCGLVAAACAIVAAGGWRATPLRLVLAGSVCMLLFAALSTLVLAFFEQNIAGAALWTNGSLYQPGATGLVLAARWLVVPLAALPFVIRPLNPLTLGDDAAAAAGVRVDATRLAATIVAVAFTSVAVSIAGPLSYVGLVAPNLLRQVRGARAARLGVLVPLSALAGGALVLVTDSAVLASGLDATLSTGVAIALVGTPLMLAMIRRGAAWSGVLHADAERATGGGSTRLVGWLERLGWPLRTVLFVMAGVLVVFVGVSAGPEWLSPARWSAALSGHDPLARMLIDLRMPRLLCALLAGALLAVSGVAMQSVVRNPLAGPEVLGVTQGAGLVTLFALSTWPLMGHVTLAAAALIGGGLSLAITLALNHRHRYAPLAVALTGIVIGALWTTLAQWLITQESVQPARFVVWLVGGTYGRSWGEVSMLLPWCVLAVPVFAWLAKPLDMLALGDDQAAALGLPVAALRPLALTIATLAACAAVAAVGPVGFIGLMAPHVATMLGARRHRTRLWLAAACGALILGVADLAARTVVAPREVPAGVLTALIGAPYLLGLLILEGRRARRAGR